MEITNGEKQAKFLAVAGKFSGEQAAKFLAVTSF